MDPSHQLGVICKRAEGTLDPTAYVIDGDSKQLLSKELKNYRKVEKASAGPGRGCPPPHPS